MKLFITLFLLISTNLFALSGNKISVAVLRLDAQDISEYKVAKITDRLRNELFKTGHLQVMEWGTMVNVLKDKGLSQPKQTSGKWLLTAGRLLGVERILGGSVRKVGGSYIISLHLIDVKKAKLLKTINEDFSGDVNDFITDLAPKMVRRIIGRDKFEYSIDHPKPKFEKPIIQLRDYQKRLKVSEVKKIVKANGFCDTGWNKKAKGIAHVYEERIIGGDDVVIDYATGLMWQQSGSLNYMDYYNVEKWLDNLNRRGFAGYHNWRLPTVEEGMSLMESEMRSGKIYIDNIFDRTQGWIWTSDLGKFKYQAWVVVFFRGYCDRSAFSRLRYVRAVRSVKFSND